MFLLNKSEYISFPNLTDGGVEFKIGQVAFSLFGIDVYWYGIILTSAVILGITYGVKFAKRAGLSGDSVFDMAFWGVLSGIIGARLYYVIFSPGRFSLFGIFDLRGGGLAVYGSLIGALIGGLLAARAKKVKFLPLADLIGIGFLIGHYVGRWGNFFNQEAFGAPTAENLPWGMTGSIISTDVEVVLKQRELLNSGIALVHPCFLYESLWCLIGFVLLHFYMKKLKSFDGEIFLLYIVWYGSGRAWIESLRTDSLMAGGLRVSQVVAVSSAAFALGLFVFFKQKLTAKKGYVMYRDTDDSKHQIQESEYKNKLVKEKGKAKSAFFKTRRELNEPFAQNIIDKPYNKEEDS
ncbi:MAG: prolipoprotein diacylglyceryl transferase [Oscillospiraceae bacterium]|nr:prolipoprotein diacylglyceryl transferase [Oscillospiraceae bacterium]